ncbi:MAG: 4Fe-4S dicluster domain-containing protein [Anaerolineae bacterium]|nr:4Fe-4S dicluster domain-containing protein [Anaerolineae bacterium]
MTARGIAVREELCTGCRACQVACVARHEGLFGVYTARLRVVKDEPLGLDRPQVCRLCGRAPCLASCRKGALSRHDTTSAVILKVELCNSCSDCLKACPFGMVGLHPQSNLPLICDLCGGEPVCVLRCPTGAISYKDSRPGSAEPPAMRLVRPDGKYSGAVPGDDE